MTWFRAILVVAIVGVVAFALIETARVPAAAPAPPPTQSPTRVPLPTLAPAAITSRISRETPEPPPRATPPAQPLVEVVDYGFSPEQLTLRLGASVTWTNDGNDGHDVTGSGPGGDWRSGPLAPSERYTRAFNLTGTYDYVCTIHPEMHGRIFVQS
ncbi:MAG TPA: plastocyanin/azurin family copper-binding protein [Chloroflexota bacterium]